MSSVTELPQHPTSAVGREVAAVPRRDIQALRAIAVSAVLVYHLWPHRLTGGYVGVDIFFVISGFLITSHLLSKPIDSVGALVAFWGRRVRRLIPAASLVLLTTLVASLLVLPETVRTSVAREVAASALYVENWVLAWTSTDYLASDELHTPVQHYWSLSVEEQFYIVWPVLLGLLVALAARRRRTGLLVPALGVGLVLVASLAWSVHLTADNPAAAYFVSTTRFWELAVGALLAIGVRASRRTWATGARVALTWLGLAMIVWTVVSFDAATPFPSAWALVPTLGTALVILGASDGLRGGPSALWSNRGVGWLGDVSYSLYLWHWPLIVLAPFALGTTLTWKHKIVIAVLALVLATLTKRFVEDPMRWNPLLRRRTSATFGMLALCTVLAVGASGVIYAAAKSSEQAAQASVEKARADAAECLGANAVRNDACSYTGDTLVTTPVFAKADKPDLYADGCWSSVTTGAHVECHYGADDATTRIALLGNSHAGHWEPPIATYLPGHDANLTTRLISQCYTVDVPIAFSSAEQRANCSAWNDWAVSASAQGGYDLIVISNRTFYALEGVSAKDKPAVAREAYRRTLDVLTAQGTPVLVLRDTPASQFEIPDCVAEHPEPDQWSQCDTPESSAIEDDPLAAVALADDDPLVSVLDINDMLCSDGECVPVIGGVIGYFDHGHMTKTFAETLAPEVEDAIDGALHGSH